MLALARDGWLVRNKVIWAKTNPMPSSIRDRLSLTWEVLYLLVRSPSYYFDLDAIREPHTTDERQVGCVSLSASGRSGPGRWRAAKTGCAGRGKRECPVTRSARTRATSGA